MDLRLQVSGFFFQLAQVVFTNCGDGPILQPEAINADVVTCSSYGGLGQRSSSGSI